MRHLTLPSVDHFPSLFSSEAKERQAKEQLAASVAALPPSADFPAWAGGGQAGYDDSGLGVEF